MYLEDVVECISDVVRRIEHAERRSTEWWYSRWNITGQSERIKVLCCEDVGHCCCADDNQYVTRYNNVISLRNFTDLFSLCIRIMLPLR